MGSTKTHMKVNDKPVLILNLAKYYGGATVRTLQIVRMLRSVDYPFCVVVLQDSPLYQRLLSDGLPVKTIKYGRGDIRIAFELRKLIQQDAYQVIDTHNPQSHLWGLLAAKLAGHCHVVTTVHGCYGEAEKGWRSKLYDAVLRWNDTPDADFISVSDSVTCYLQKIGIHKAKVTYSVNAIMPVGVSKLTLRQLAGWSEDTLVITIAARLEPVKGIEYLVQAFALAWKTCPQLRLCIIGEGRQRIELESLVDALGVGGSVYFSGFRQDAPELLSTADIFCLASVSEGLPFALLEAAMAKLPLVLSNVGGMAEFFTHEQTALLFPVKDVKQMSDCFILLAKQPDYRRKLAESAYKWVAEQFSAARMFEQTLEIYRKRVL